MPIYRRSIDIRAPVEEVFAFHMDAGNIARLALPESKTEVVSRGELPLRTGSRVVVRSLQMGIPVTLEAEIVALEPNRMFEDRQVRGPFQRWRHLHLFEPTAEGARVTDEVEFELPGGPAARLALNGVVLGQLEKAFAHRHAALRRLLEGEGERG